MTPAKTNGGPVADLTVGPAPPPEVRARTADDAALASEPGLADEVDVPPQLDPEVVRSFLMGAGGLLGHVLGDSEVPDHWRVTPRELDELAGRADAPGPLTRIINRNAGLRRAVIRGDEMAVAVVLAGYAGRNVAAGKKARDRRRGLEREAGDAAGDGRADGSGEAGQSGGWRGDDGRLPGAPGGGDR